jgi:DNA polymerase III delta prime subunit
VLARDDRGVLYVSGGTGQGKTSLAHALAGELGIRRGGPHWIEIDGSGCDVATVRALDADARKLNGNVLFQSPNTIVIVNECHAMTPAAVQAWLTLLERLPANWWIVFTTTCDSGDLFGEFSSPFADRCTCVRLTNQGLCKLFARFVHHVATREDLNGKPLGAYEGLAKQCRNSLRAMLQAVDDGVMIDD